MHVSRGGFSISRSEDDFIQAAEKLGWKENKDIQGLTGTNGIQRALRYISPEGRRQDSAHTYLHPYLRDGKHGNLHVLVESQVERVLFEGNKAVGVSYKVNPTFASEDSKRTDAAQLLKARRMVIISSGACATPSILERSGVGNPDILSNVGVPLLSNVPGVGENYGDHTGALSIYKSDLAQNETMDGLFRGQWNVPELIAKDDPILGWNAMDITSKVRPSESEVAALGPAFQEIWVRDYKDDPDKPLAIITLVNR